MLKVVCKQQECQAHRVAMAATVADATTAKMAGTITAAGTVVLATEAVMIAIRDAIKTTLGVAEATRAGNGDRKAR